MATPCTLLGTRGRWGDKGPRDNFKAHAISTSCATSTEPCPCMHYKTTSFVTMLVTSLYPCRARQAYCKPLDKRLLKIFRLVENIKTVIGVWGMYSVHLCTLYLLVYSHLSDSHLCVFTPPNAKLDKLVERLVEKVF